MDRRIPVGAQFSIISRAFKKELDAILLEEDITGVQFSVLVVLSGFEGSGTSEISQHMLEEAVHVAHPTMIGIIKKLSSKGFIECRPAENDRRCKCISSTPKSQNLLRRMDSLNDSIWNKLSRGLSDEQQKLLLGFTEIIIDNICTCEKRKE